MNAESAFWGSDLCPFTWGWARTHGRMLCVIPGLLELHPGLTTSTSLKALLRIVILETNRERDFQRHKWVNKAKLKRQHERLAPLHMLKSPRIRLEPWTFHMRLEGNTDFSESDCSLLFLAFKAIEQTDTCPFSSISLASVFIWCFFFAPILT